MRNKGTALIFSEVQYWNDVVSDKRDKTHSKEGRLQLQLQYAVVLAIESIDPTLWGSLFIRERKKMSQLDTQKFQQLEGFYRIIGNRSKYWEIRGNIVKQYDPHGLFPESKEMAIEYGDLGKNQRTR